MAVAGRLREFGLSGLGLGRTGKPLPACTEVKVKWGGSWTSCSNQIQVLHKTLNVVIVIVPNKNPDKLYDTMV